MKALRDELEHIHSIANPNNPHGKGVQKMTETMLNALSVKFRGPNAEEALRSPIPKAEVRKLIMEVLKDSGDWMYVPTDEEPS